MKYLKPKGTKDIYLEEMAKWQNVESKIREVAKEYNMSEIRTPVFESTELFTRSVGDETDIVNKEMYTFEDRGGRSITLRPENTAGVVRAYIENGMSSAPSPVKLWYLSNVYRYEKMQKGRYREFNQFGVEILGSASYMADVEAILIPLALFKKLDILDEVTLNINSIGCTACRAKYIEKLKSFLKDNLDEMCSDCKVRFYKNPLRIIDCKQKKCKEILQNKPNITDYLCEDCSNHFEKVKETLDSLNVKYNINPDIVRGLDYYNRTVFEYVSNTLDLTVCGGGRYDTLVELCQGPKTPAVGFGLGMERLILLLDDLEKNKIQKELDIYITYLSEKEEKTAYKLATDIRAHGLSVEVDILGRSFKAQMKQADKLNAAYTIALGEDEISNNIVNIKNMQNKEESFTADLDANVIAKAVKAVNKK
ncbi:MAG: histidine--tRNA ligase [Clostridia bacterium]